MKATRYVPLDRNRNMMDHPTGDWVTYKDYKEMEDYANSLVELTNLPCLPKDLENLREVNLAFATENHKLKELLAACFGSKDLPLDDAMKKFVLTQVGVEIMYVNGEPRTSLTEQEIKEYQARLVQVVKHGLHTGSISPESVLNLLWKDDRIPIRGGKLKNVWYL
jgi:hypothetical protein